MTEPDNRSIHKRLQILAGAETVFTKDGFEGASMSRIAHEANVSKGTLYNYFDGKSVLFAAFVSQKTELELPKLFDPIAAGDSMEAVLHQIAAGMIRLMLSPCSLQLYRIVVAEGAKFPQLAEIFWETGPQNALNRMSDWVSLRMDAGQLRRDDPHFVAGQFFALCQTPDSSRRRLRIGSDLTDTQVSRIVEGAVRVFLDSYALHP